MYKLAGNWKSGLAFDLHTVSSVYLGVDPMGHDRFDNTRSKMGELVYQLKYHEDQSTIPKIIKLLALIEGIETLDAIIPAPSSRPRAAQPVDMIAQALGAQRNVPVLLGYLTKDSTVELKGLDDPAERANALRRSIKIGRTESIAGKKVLLLDDLYRSGATLCACCEVLNRQAKVAGVWALTMTKTRSNT